MKKILFSLILLTQILFFAEQTLAAELSDYTLLQDVGYKIDSSKSAVLDLDKNTFYSLTDNEHIMIDLDNPYVFIESFYMKFELKGKSAGGFNSVNIRTLSTDGKVGYLKYTTSKNTDEFFTEKFDTRNFKTITIQNMGKVDFYEFAIKGEIVTTAPVDGIKATATDSSVNLEWNLPSIPGLSHVEVNGKNIGKTTNYKQDGLESLTEYNYEIKTVFTNSKTETVNTKVKTLRDEIPPQSVKKLSLNENESSKVELTYDLPTDSDFTHVSILRDDVVIAANVKANTFTDTSSLTAGQEYKYSIIAYDKSGNASTVVSEKIKMRTKTMMPINNLRLEQSGQNVVINFDLPKDDAFSHVRIWRDNQSIVSTLKSNAHTDLTRLLYNREYTYKIIAYDKNANASAAVEGKITLIEKYVEPIRNLKVTQVSDRNADLTYVLPSGADFDHVKIYRNGMLLANNHKTNQYEDKTTLAYNVEYTYKIVAYDKTNMPSTDVIGKVKIQSRDVTNLKASATYDSVSLNWNLPTADEFEKVVIYRKDEKAPLLKRIAAFFTGGLETALFETNGTTFKDLTVESDVSYVYRIASVYGTEETSGLAITVKTAKLTASGGGTSVDENGDYKITWEKPETGKMKVLVGGVEYATVPATDKKITIPKADMKYDLIGKTDVKLIPVKDDGTEGIPTVPGGVGGGMGGITGGGEVAKELNASNVLKGGVGLLGVVGAFILLGLAFKMSPRLITLIRSALGEKKVIK